MEEYGGEEVFVSFRLFQRPPLSMAPSFELLTFVFSTSTSSQKKTTQQDEILKAAVMKYGLNQWARISSLLVRKTPKQCKARWFEWLDPSIVKTEWTRAEDERLLHLAKLMPTQWRTIAPVVGRTPAQCLDRYERLLDRAAAREAAGGEEGEGGAGPSSSAAPLYSRRDDPRRLRPGEIDPNPEGKPARPDAVDMDDEEKEMLSEARARLANTRGKKAKRKAREKALDEARRLAALQKQRELRAAGVEVREPKRQKRAIDYNAEVPFEHRPAAGFFDTAEEDEEAARRAERFEVRSLDEVEGAGAGASSRAATARLREAKAAAKAAAAPSLGGALEDGGAGGGPPRRRGKLMLPAPVVSDAELGLLARGGGDGAGGQELEAAAGAASTAALVEEYRAATAPSSLASRLPAPMRTPRVAGASGGDRVLDEAAALAALVAGRTPLLGGEREGGGAGGAAAARARALASSDFSGATPRGGAASTPHALHRHGDAQTALARRGGSVGPGATPLRDSLGLNGGGGGGALARGRADARNPLLAGLASLPKPRNEYSVVVPISPVTEEEEEEEEAREREVLRGGGGGTDRGEGRRAEDAEDEARRAAAAAARAGAAAEASRSQVLRRGLPRPSGAPPLAASPSPTGDASLDAAAALLDAELAALLEHDAVTHPRGADGSSSKSRGRGDAAAVPRPPPEGWVAVSPAELDAARAALLTEAGRARPGGPRAHSAEDVAEAAERERASWIVDVAAAAGKSSNPDLLLVHSASAPPALRAASLKAQFDAVRSEMERQAVRAARLDERARALAAPAAAQGARAAAAAAEAGLRASAAARDEAAFAQLAEREHGAALSRIAAMRLRADAQAEREAGLQARFAALVEERDALRKLLGAEEGVGAVRKA